MRYFISEFAWTKSSHVSFIQTLLTQRCATTLTSLNSYAKKAEELKAVSLASAMETVEKLEVKLAEFAKKHKHEIQHDPVFRAKFLDMCAPLGTLGHERLLFADVIPSCTCSMGFSK